MWGNVYTDGYGTVWVGQLWRTREDCIHNASRRNPPIYRVKVTPKRKPKWD